MLSYQAGVITMMTTTSFVDEFYIDSKKLWLAATALLEADKIHEDKELRREAFKGALVEAGIVSEDEAVCLADKSFMPAEQEIQNVSGL